MTGHARGTLALAVWLLAPAGGAAEGSDATGAAAALARFKSLAGEWLAAEDGEMAKKGTLVARYAVTASGSAVVETVFPGTPHEMVTLYHAEGRDLVLTHYCVNGNQPRMRARDAAAPRIEFAFDGGANVDPRRGRHMHSAVFEFVGPDELKNAWTEHADGKPVLTVQSHLVRRAR
jgi:hypothetical protein